MTAKETQARKYAKSQNSRFLILLNGNLHSITRFPSPESIKGYHRFEPNPQRLIDKLVEQDYIDPAQMPTYVIESKNRS